MRSTGWVVVDGQFLAEVAGETLVVAKHGAVRIARFAVAGRSAVLSYRPGRDTFRVRCYGDLSGGPSSSRGCKQLDFHAKNSDRAFAIALAFVDLGIAAVYSLLEAEAAVRKGQASSLVSWVRPTLRASRASYADYARQVAEGPKVGEGDFPRTIGAGVTSLSL
jgi:hypothetical protein